MFLKQVRVKAFAIGFKTYGSLPEEWTKSTYKYQYRKLAKQENKNPAQIYTIIGKTKIQEGYTEYLGSDEGVAFVQMKSNPVYLVANGIGRMYKVLEEDLEFVEETNEQSYRHNTLQQ